MLQLMGQKPKSTRFPLKEKALLKDSPPPQNFKKAQPQEIIPLQNSPDPSKVRGGHTLILLVTLAFCHVSNKETRNE